MQMPQGLGAQHSGDVRGDGNLLRAQTAAAGLAVNAQLRADETRMKQVGRRDVLERLLAMIAEEKAKLAEEERLERGETEGSVNAADNEAFV